MTEHMRTEEYQWCDADRCMVIDVVTGAHERFGSLQEAVGSLVDALSYVERRRNWSDRLIIVKLSAIVAHKIDSHKPSPPTSHMADM